MNRTKAIQALAIFAIVSGASIGILFLFRPLNFFNILLSVYLGAFVIYLLLRRGFFSERAHLFLHGETSPRRAQIRRTPSKRSRSEDSEARFVRGNTTENTSPEDRVIGILTDGKAFALPITILGVQEAVTLGRGRGSVTVTWWPVTYSARAFNEELHPGKHVIYNSSLLLDTSGNTWVQFAGQRVSNPPSNEQLSMTPIILTTWNAWRSAYPESELLIKEDAPKHDMFERYYISQRAGLYPERLLPDRIAEKEVVLGVEVGMESRAWPYSALIDNPVLNEEVDRTPLLVAYERISSTALLFDRRVEGRVLSFSQASRNPALNLPLDNQPTDSNESEQEEEQNKTTEYEPLILVDSEGGKWYGITGECIEGRLKGIKMRHLNGMTGFWFAWRKFHPNTTLFSVTSDSPSTPMPV